MDKITSTSEFAFSTTRWEGDALRNKGESYGYGRVSTKQQNLDRQLVQFAILPIKKSNIFVDKENGSTFNRTNYKKLVKKLKPGVCSGILPAFGDGGGGRLPDTI